MRKICLIAVAVAFACGGSSKPTNVYVATMTSANEVGANANTSPATGTATFTVNATTVDYVITFNNLQGPISAAHIHSGAAGESNSPVTPPFALPSPATATGTLNGSFTAAQITAGSASSGILAGDLNSLVAAMKTGKAYANVHSTAHTGGEIRGQINPQ
ncbi:MAG: CHRD domain-containing protein [Deltaproteobacteria bacterium]